MIHYRLLDTFDNPINDTIYRSIKRARAAHSCPLQIVAFRSRSEARAMSKIRLRVCHWDYEGTPTPRIFNAEDVARFINAHELAKSSFHPKYPPSSASGRRDLERRFDATLFGFVGDVSVNCAQSMNVSCKWVRYSCPIWIDGRKSNIKGLEKLT